MRYVLQCLGTGALVCFSVANLMAQGTGTGVGGRDQSAAQGTQGAGQGTSGQGGRGTQAGQGAAGGVGQGGAGAIGGATSTQSADQQIAACLYYGNRNEVEVSRFVQDKLQSDEAKEFARQMVKEHTQMMEKLARVAGPYVAGQTGTSGQGSEEGQQGRTVGGTSPRTLEGNNVSGTAGASTRTGGHLDFMAIHRQIADQCLQSTRQALQRKEGEQLDKAYIGMQIAAHMKMKDELTVLQNYASGELRRDIEQGLEATESHLKHAKKIMKEEDEDNRSEGRESSRRSESK